MKVLITGICGYVGSRTAAWFKKSAAGIEVFGIDNLSRRGSETSIEPLKKMGVKFYHGDVRSVPDVEALPSADWVIDCAANPSVLAGTDAHNAASTRQLIGHNLSGTINMLEYSRSRKSGFILLSTSRVYSINALLSLKLKTGASRFEPVVTGRVKGFSKAGVAEDFSTEPPLSIYGATKLASEIMALEYANAFSFPLWIDRCGVIGGPGQFGKADQGIFSFWAYSCALGRPPKYIGFGGRQVRDIVSAEDIAELMLRQIRHPGRKAPKIINAGGGNPGAMSLREINNFCSDFFGRKFNPQMISGTRPYDVPYYVTDSALALKNWGWRPSRGVSAIMGDICGWAAQNTGLIKTWLS
ncbi:MAG TPA: CDP-tyvelose epimerase [Elusimicrobia bacterium]|nr:CDP-tyvelose epimerase [Elusimicrobiota bacterium]